MSAGYTCRLVSNLSVGGARTDQILASQVPSASTSVARWVVVEGGGNDVTQGVSAATIEANLSLIWSRLRATGKKVIATTILPSTSMDTSSEQTVIGAVNTWIRSQSSSYDLLCDWNSAMNDGSEWDPHDAYFSDGVHPNATGQGVMAGVLAPVLRSVV